MAAVWHIPIDAQGRESDEQGDASGHNLVSGAVARCYRIKPSAPPVSTADHSNAPNQRPRRSATICAPCPLTAHRAAYPDSRQAIVPSSRSLGTHPTRPTPSNLAGLSGRDSGGGTAGHRRAAPRGGRAEARLHCRKKCAECEPTAPRLGVLESTRPPRVSGINEPLNVPHPPTPVARTLMGTALAPLQRRPRCLSITSRENPPQPGASTRPSELARGVSHTESRQPPGGAT